MVNRTGWNATYIDEAASQCAWLLYMGYCGRLCDKCTYNICLYGVDKDEATLKVQHHILKYREYMAEYEAQAQYKRRIIKQIVFVVLATIGFIFFLYLMGGCYSKPVVQIQYNSRHYPSYITADIYPDIKIDCKDAAIHYYITHDQSTIRILYGHWYSSRGIDGAHVWIRTNDGQDIEPYSEPGRDFKSYFPTVVRWENVYDITDELMRAFYTRVPIKWSN